MFGAGWLVVLLGLTNLAIGSVQVLSFGEAGLFYPENPMPGVLFGTFANRNSTGLFLVCCLTLAALLPPLPKLGRAAMLIRLLTCLLLVLAIVLTRSRTALVLAALPLAICAFQMSARKILSSGRQSPNNRDGGWQIMAGAVLALGIVGSMTVVGGGRLIEVIERFNTERTDARQYIWEDAAYSAARYWPVGAGSGTFDEIFQVDESLENLTQRRAGRAHNDFLEVAVEAGLPGVLLAASWLFLLASLSWKARTSKDRWIAWSGAAILLAIASQSATDYPLRNHTVLAIAGFALIILVRFGKSDRIAAQ